MSDFIYTRAVVECLRCHHMLDTLFSVMKNGAKIRKRYERLRRRNVGGADQEAVLRDVSPVDGKP